MREVLGGGVGVRDSEPFSSSVVREVWWVGHAQQAGLSLLAYVTAYIICF